MTTEEFNQLEKLFSKLCIELGGNPICILNGQFADAWHIGIYENNSKIGRNLTGANLQQVAEKIISLP